jgi:hypothetical protein
MTYYSDHKRVAPHLKIDFLGHSNVGERLAEFEDSGLDRSEHISHSGGRC